MLVDTGSAVSLLRLDVWKRIMAGSLAPCPTLRLLGAGGEPLSVHGRAYTTLLLGTKSFPLNMVVVDPLTSPAILGLDFLMDQQATISFSDRTLQLKEEGCKFALEEPPTHGGPATKLTVRSAATVEVPARRSMHIQGTVTGAKEGLWLLEEAAK